MAGVEKIICFVEQKLKKVNNNSKIAQELL